MLTSVDIENLSFSVNSLVELLYYSVIIGEQFVLNISGVLDGNLRVLAMG